MDQSKTIIVEAFITDSEGKILLLKRSKNNKYFIGKWQLPGGKVEFGEDLQKAIRREIKEETGRMAIKPRLERVFSVKEKYKGKNSEVLLLVYSVKIKGPVFLGKEHSEFKFVYKKDIDKSSLMAVSKVSLFSKK